MSGVVDLSWNAPGARLDSLSRARSGCWMLSRARFGSSFILEGSVLTAEVGPASVVGCCHGPALAAVSFWKGQS